MLSKSSPKWLSSSCVTAFALLAIGTIVLPPVACSNSPMLTDAQFAINSALHKDDWRIVLSHQWKVLGPFPMHAREQHFISPSYPLNLSKPIDFSAMWPSAYADKGFVTWRTAESTNGTLHLSYPDIRWASLRATEGWASLQHHSTLRTTITVHPPKNHHGPAPDMQLLIDVQQGSFFAVRPSEDSDQLADTYIPKWYAGNIYAMDAAPPQSVPLPSAPSTTAPTAYELIVSGDYEIRLFGDPTVRRSDIPTLSITVGVSIETLSSSLGIAESHHVIPNLVEGWAFGDALGIGLRSSGEWWTVKDVKLADSLYEILTVHLLDQTRLAPTQTRVVPIALRQRLPFYDTSMQLHVHLVSESSLEVTLPVVLQLKHARAWGSNEYDPIISTYLYASTTPTAFIAIPPMRIGPEGTTSPILALHGAGVNVLTHPLWVCSPPRQSFRWIVMPTGRTAWGLDWHGPSTIDAWASLEALSSILNRRPQWSSWGFPKYSRVVLLGHSNGGQGAWYVAARYPDRILAAIPAAAYSKAQSYVSLVQSRSAHFIDPSLRAILETSFTPDDNDLFVSNLVDTPILAIHGGADENVPVWHTRTLVDTLKTWKHDANVTFKEDPGQPHCYETVFQNDEVQAFIDSIRHTDQSSTLHEFSGKYEFTLTVAIPSESGSLHGFRVLKLETPGRLARLFVEGTGHIVQIMPRNVAVFSIDSRYVNLKNIQIYVDGVLLEFALGQDEYLIWHRMGVWTVEAQSLDAPFPPAGRMSKILSSSGPLTLIVPHQSPESINPAIRIAHNLDVYHKLDAEIISASQAIDRLENGSLGQGNIITIGDVENAFTRRLLEKKATPFSLSSEGLLLRGRAVPRQAASLFLHPHPTSKSSLVLVMYANEERGLERLLRVLPIRTGISVPDWVVLGPSADYVGAGGVDGAGLWGDDWSWNNAMSLF